MNLLQVKVYVYFAILLLSSFFGSIFLGSICVISFIFKPTWYRFLYDRAVGAWEWLAAALLEKFLSIEIVTTGDSIDPDEQCLILMNHRTCFDWMYFWNVLIRQSKVYKEKIVLKSSLKNAPGAGWAMQGAGFLFLNRKWEQDETYLNVILNYYKSINYKSQILIFPEGTDLNKRSKLRSDLFAKENGLQVYEHVLQPRTTGFVHIASTLREAWDSMAIYDITISYDSTPPQNEREMIRGILPNRVFFHIKRYDASEIPQTKEALANWCLELWAKKEAQLKDFYTHKNYPSSKRDSIYFHLLLYVVIFLWMGFISLSIYFSYQSCYVLSYVILTCFAYVAFTNLGGLEILTAKCKRHILY